MTFAIQSGEYSADDLNARADAFITTLPEFIRTMDTATFSQLVESAIEQLEKEPKSIAERANKLKDLVFEHGSDFDRDKKTISALKSADQNSLADLLFNTINEDSRKMVNSLMFAEQHKNKQNRISSFDDIKSWKKSRIYQ
jgi:secreted Zn-dependent insulinase-like peptidase